MDIKSRNTEKKLKQQICHLNDFLSFLSDIYRMNKTLSCLFNLNIAILQHNISLNQYHPGQSLADVITQKYGRWLKKEDDKLFKRDICCFDFRSNFLVLISILLNIGRER